MAEETGLLEQRMTVNPFGNQAEHINPKSQRTEEAQSQIDPLVEEALLVFSPRIYSYDHLPALTPGQIDTVLSLIIQRYDRKAIEMQVTYRFFEGLVRKSHDLLGHTDFTLTTGGYEIEYLPHLRYLEAKINVTMNGNAGRCAGYESQDMTIIVQGNAGDMFGGYSIGGNFTVKGNAADSCGTRAYEGVFTVHGETGEGLGNAAINSTFTVYGKIKDIPLLMAEACTLKTTDDAAYQYVCSSPPQNRNMAILIDKQGNELKRRYKTW